MPLVLQAVVAPRVAPTLTILEWAKRDRIVSFRMEASQPIATIAASLAGKGGSVAASLSATNASAVTGLQLPVVATGKYTLMLAITDQRGGTATASRKAVEVTT